MGFSTALECFVCSELDGGDIDSVRWVVQMGGPSWTVVLGRKDGLNSTEGSVAGHLPGADMDVKKLMGIFSSIGLSTQDLVTLSGTNALPKFPEIHSHSSHSSGFFTPIAPPLRLPPTHHQE